VREVIAKVPADRCRVITSHNAFGYFQDAYGLSFTAPQGVSTEAEASAKDVAAIISQIKKQKAGGTLYSDALTDEHGDATTYIDLIRHNLKQLAAALTS
jgi:zinc/manganese transport system substrate-binding protein